MRTAKKITFIVLMSILFNSYNNAQVYFKLDMTEDEKTYIVSMIPEVTLEAPMNMVSTAQVTLKLSSDNNFVINNLRSSLRDVRWHESYAAASPKEAPDYEYISFGLVSLATRSIPFEIGKEVELFRFDNLGDCPGSVSIVDNETDEFLFPNSKSVSISNGITVLGLGTSAYLGAIHGGEVSCITPESRKEEIIYLEQSVNISPNPASNLLNVEFTNPENTTAQEIKIFNLEGQLIHNESITTNPGKHNFTMGIKDWSPGSYLMYIENDNGITEGKRFVKVGAL